MYDLAIIGGGINGTAIACDAAGRGLSVFLCEKDDLAAHTSSASTKLIHGGLRYLEQYDFGLVREALKEREILLNKAPHIIWPLEFVMPHEQSIRPYWMIRLGLFLYDHLAGRKKLNASRSITFNSFFSNPILKEQYQKGFIYSDCWVDDARLVVLNAMQAQEHGANIQTRCECISTKRLTNYWQLTLRNNFTNNISTIDAKVIVNAAGPWVDDIAINKLHVNKTKKVIMIKGSHIVVPKIHTEPYAFILQHTDKRVCFVIPYLDKYSLIGTTDINFENDPQQVEITHNEIIYLCDVVNQYFRHSIKPEHVVWSYSGVRPLMCDDADSPSNISRDYELELIAEKKSAAVLNVYGGKITTHRTLAEDAMKLLKPILPHMGNNWTANCALPGGDIDSQDFDTFVNQLTQMNPTLSSKLIYRYARQYGTRALEIISGVKKLDDLGEHFGASLYQKEIDYLINKEFARSAEDILWRRTKLGLELNDSAIAKLRSLDFK